MKNISKRIACVVLSLLCVFVSTYTVYADNSGESNWEHLSNGHVVVNGVEYEPMEENQVMHELSYIANKLGVVGKILKGTANFGMSIEILSGTGAMVRDDAGNIYMKTDRKTEDGDNIKFSSDYVNGVRNGIADIIQTEDGYIFYPTYKYLFSAAYIGNDYWAEQYNSFKDKITSSPYEVFRVDVDFRDDGFISSFELLDLTGCDFYIDSSDDSVFHIGVGKGERFYSSYYETVFINYFSSDGFTNCSLGVPTFLYKDSASHVYYKNGDISSRYLYTKDGHAVKIWNSSSALRKYYDSHGVQNFYTSNTYNNYNVNNDNSITINKKVYNDTDYETINNNNYTTINNTVNKYYEKNNTTIDTSSIEDIIKKFQDDQAKRDQELLDKVEDNNNKTDEGNQINKETNEKLDKIYEILQQIAGSLSGGSGGGSGASGSDFDMNTLIQMLNNLQLSLDTMWQVDLKQIQSNLNTIVNNLKSDNADSKSILEDIYKTQQQILELQQANLNQNKTFFDSVIDYLKKITHALTAGNIIDTLDTLLNLKDDADGLSDFVDGIVGDIEPTVSLMKTKFPTSIPWDIIAVISVMACEPQTPRFEIPVNIDIMGQKYEDVLVIDLEQFDRVARFGRALLSVMFTLWLLLVTKRLLYGGES